MIRANNSNNTGFFLSAYSLAILYVVGCGGNTQSLPTNTTSEASVSSISSLPISSSSTSSSSTIDLNTATYIPDASWSCGLTEGLPDPTAGELILSASIQVGDTYQVGVTQFGERLLLGVAGGNFSGPRLEGQFLRGGLELELTLSNGGKELEQINVLRTNDGTNIFMRNCGFAPAGAEVIRFVPGFEAPNSSSYAWLNQGRFAGTRTYNPTSGTIDWEIYDISEISPIQAEIQIADPVGLPNQSWECSQHSGVRGASIVTEEVALGNTINIGSSTLGSRNIIEITGGYFNGRFSGEILSGGADYQLTPSGGGPTVLDARYTLKASDGEYILVRNCGPFGGLVPTFEARNAGPYNYLNQNNYLSSDPGFSGSGVSITFYEIQ